MIEKIVARVDSWDEESVRNFAKETILSYYQRAPDAAIRREYEIIKRLEKENGKA